MKSLCISILLLLVLLSSCRLQREAPVNEKPTLFSRLGVVSIGGSNTRRHFGRIERQSAYKIFMRNP